MLGASQKYRELLQKQEKEDEENRLKLEELRKKKLRDDIKRKRETEDARKRDEAIRLHRNEELRRKKEEQSKEEERKKQAELEKERKRPLTVAEAKARREQVEASRKVQGIAKRRQDLPAAVKPISSSYSSLLASAPTTLEKLEVRPKSPPKRKFVEVKKDATRGHKKINQLDLTPLQKDGKRDLRTIEEIQNDIHRKKGKDYAYLQSSTAKPVETSKAPIKPVVQPRPVSRSIESPKKSIPHHDSEDDYRAHTGGQSIWEIMNPGKSRTQYLARDLDSDSDMEADAASIAREESRAARQARQEDEREEALLAAAKRKKLLKRS